jgi:hypothetical protein
MMLLTKLKAVAVTVLTLAALSGGFGLGLVPAYGNIRGDGLTVATKATIAQQANPADPKVIERIDQIITAKWTEEVDDATFLRRLSLDLRGLLPTPVEAFFFIADNDKDKRTKVVTWMVDDDSVKAYAAKKLRVDVKRIHSARLVDASDGKVRHLVVVLDLDVDGKPQAVAFSQDGKTLTIELRADGKYVTPRVAPFVTDLDVTIKPTANPDAKRVVLSADKNAKWVELHDTILRLQPDAKGASTGDSIWLDVLTGDAKNPKARVFGDVDIDGKLDLLLTAQGQTQYHWAEVVDFTTASESDADFLKRVIQDVRRGAPTALEQKYFVEDKDPKKREKLLDMLLKDPAVAKKLGDDWKKKMLATTRPTTVNEHTFEYKLAPTVLDGKTFQYKIAPTELKGQTWKYELKLDPKGAGQPQLLNTDPKKGTWSYVKPMTFKVETPKTPTAPNTPTIKEVKIVPKPPKPQADKLDKVVGELLAAKKSDADVLDGITLVVLNRLPTDAEKRLTLGLISKAADRKAAWLEVARALAATGQGKQRSDAGGAKGVIDMMGKVTNGNTFELFFTTDGKPEFKTSPPGKK